MLRNPFRLFLVFLGIGLSSCSRENIDEYLYKTNLDIRGLSPFPFPLKCQLETHSNHIQPTQKPLRAFRSADVNRYVNDEYVPEV